MLKGGGSVHRLLFLKPRQDWQIWIARTKFLQVSYFWSSLCKNVIVQTSLEYFRLNLRIRCFDQNIFMAKSSPRSAALYALLCKNSIDCLFLLLTSCYFVLFVSICFKGQVNFDKITLKSRIIHSHSEKADTICINLSRRNQLYTIRPIRFQNCTQIDNCTLIECVVELY